MGMYRTVDGEVNKIYGCHMHEPARGLGPAGRRRNGVVSWGTDKPRRCVFVASGPLAPGRGLMVYRSPQADLKQLVKHSAVCS